MILLADADLVLPDRVLSRGSVLLDGERIVAIEPRPIDTPRGATRVELAESLIVPGFIDVHVHGVEGHDVLDGPGTIAEVASRLPGYGVTAFCPTSIACDPTTLRHLLEETAALAADRSHDAARVLPAHLESNFINADYRGAQPLHCLRSPRSGGHAPPEFSGNQILEVIANHRVHVGIVTLAPELDGGLELVAHLTAAGHRVSLGHSGATYDDALAAIDAGVSHATHVFNRMTPISHRSPGASGAMLQSEQVIAELICDGFHVHPAVMELAIRSKGPRGIMAITDGTAGSGLPVGSRTRLGGQPIIVTNRTAELADGTRAGSVLTMDAAFRTLVQQTQVSVVDAARMCATTPAEHMGLADTGRIAVGAAADLVVLDAAFQVRQTYLRGRLWRNTDGPPFV